MNVGVSAWTINAGASILVGCLGFALSARGIFRESARKSERFMESICTLASIALIYSGSILWNTIQALADEGPSSYLLVHGTMPTIPGLATVLVTGSSVAFLLLATYAWLTRDKLNVMGELFCAAVAGNLFVSLSLNRGSAASITMSILWATALVTLVIMIIMIDQRLQLAATVAPQEEEVEEQSAS